MFKIALPADRGETDRFAVAMTFGISKQQLHAILQPPGSAPGPRVTGTRKSTLRVCRFGPNGDGGPQADTFRVDLADCGAGRAGVVLSDPVM